MAGIVLDARLGAVAELVGVVKSVADIGSDHGQFGCWMLQNNRCERVQFLDISADSLMKARRLVARLGLEDRAVFGVGDGTKAMVEPADAVVIAGMGGQLIGDIVEAGADALRGSRLVMQPNVAARELRERLGRSCYDIVDERLVLAAGRMYVVIAASSGAARYDEKQTLVGPRLLERRDPLLPAYARRRLGIARKALRGAVQADAPWRRDLEFECEVWEGILREGDSAGDL